MLMVGVRLSFQWKKLRLNNNFIFPKLIGHRGVKDLKPENTLDSIQKANEENSQLQLTPKELEPNEFKVLGSDN